MAEHTAEQTAGRGDEVSIDVASNFFHQNCDRLAMIFKSLKFVVKVPVVPEEPQDTSAEGRPNNGDEDDHDEPKKKWKLFKRGKKKDSVEKPILDDITGIFRPGRLTAVMGASGAGKTTLLSVLAGNVEGGTISGSIQINGEDFSEPGKMQKISGFVFQDDILLPTMTVREAIKMSALLRLPKEVSEEERMKRVEDIVKVLHLKRAQNTKVGDPIKKGISGGERKRTSTQEFSTIPSHTC